MNKSLKVYGVNYDGRHRRIVAAKNQNEAAKLIRVTVYHLRAYGCATGNKEEIDVAMSVPGTVFESRINSGSGDKWRMVER